MFHSTAACLLLFSRRQVAVCKERKPRLLLRRLPEHRRRERWRRLKPPFGICRQRLAMLISQRTKPLTHFGGNVRGRPLCAKR